MMRVWVMTISILMLLLGLSGCKSDARMACESAAPEQTAAPAETPASAPAAVVRAAGRDELIVVGQRAPNFKADDQDGKPVELSRLLRTRNVVLIFYPGDDTPGCTKQLCAVRDDWAGFRMRNAIVLGVNPAGISSHAAFATKYNFPFPVLSDKGGHIAAAYGARGQNPEKPQRTVYVIRRDGRVGLAERGMVSHEKIFAALDY